MTCSDLRTRQPDGRRRTNDDTDAECRLRRVKRPTRGTSQSPLVSCIEATRRLLGNTDWDAVGVCSPRIHFGRVPDSGSARVLRTLGAETTLGRGGAARRRGRATSGASHGQPHRRASRLTRSAQGGRTKRRARYVMVAQRARSSLQVHGRLISRAPPGPTMLGSGRRVASWRARMRRSWC